LYLRHFDVVKENFEIFLPFVIYVVKIVIELMGEKMTSLRMALLLVLSVLMTIMFACTPSYPSYTPNPHIEKQGATPQYSFFGSAQIQYPTQTKDATINIRDNGQGNGDNVGDSSNDNGFTFDL